MHEEAELRGLAAGLRGGRREDWERFYALVHLPLLRLLRRLLRDDARAEEALQATFLTAIEKIASYDPDLGTPDAWVAGIARHKALEAVRVRSAEPVEVDLIPAPSREPDADAEMVARALDGLEPRFAEVLRRKYLAGESIEAIALALDLNQTTVGTLLHRGRERFRAAYRRLEARANARVLDRHREGRDLP